MDDDMVRRFAVDPRDLVPEAVRRRFARTLAAAMRVLRCALAASGQ